MLYYVVITFLMFAGFYIQLNNISLLNRAQQISKMKESQKKSNSNMIYILISIATLILVPYIQSFKNKADINPLNGLKDVKMNLNSRKNAIKGINNNEYTDKINKNVAKVQINQAQTMCQNIYHKNNQPTAEIKSLNKKITDLQQQNAKLKIQINNSLSENSTKALLQSEIDNYLKKCKQLHLQIVKDSTVVLDDIYSCLNSLSINIQAEKKKTTQSFSLKIDNYFEKCKQLHSQITKEETRIASNIDQCLDSIKSKIMTQEHFLNQCYNAHTKIIPLYDKNNRVDSLHECWKTFQTALKNEKLMKDG